MNVKMREGRIGKGHKGPLCFCGRFPLAGGGEGDEKASVINHGKRNVLIEGLLSLSLSLIIVHLNWLVVFVNTPQPFFGPCSNQRGR